MEANLTMKILPCGINFTPELTGIVKYTGEMAAWLVAVGQRGGRRKSLARGG